MAIISPAEKQVLHELMQTGAGNRALAKRLHKSEDTIKSQMKALLREFGVSTRSELMAEVMHERHRVIVSHSKPMTRRKIVALTRKGEGLAS